jgi:hypothetical protein
METPSMLRKLKSHGLISPVFSSLQLCILIWAARSLIDQDGMLALGW